MRVEAGKGGTGPGRSEGGEYAESVLEDVRVPIAVGGRVDVGGRITVHDEEIGPGAFAHAAARASLRLGWC